MRVIKNEMVEQLFNMLRECNLSDCTDGDNENDLPAYCSYQDNLHGHIGDAIKALGYEGEYQLYVLTGDRPVDFSMTEETVRAVFESEMFNNDFNEQVNYIIERNNKWRITQLEEIYKTLN